MLFSIEDECCGSVKLGLIRLVKNIPEVPFFFRLNQETAYGFHRLPDLEIETEYHLSSFSVYEGLHPLMMVPVRLISNASNQILQTKNYDQLFVEDSGIKFLLNEYPEVSYLTYFPDAEADFSLLLLPKNLTFSIQELELEEDHILASTLLYYDP